MKRREADTTRWYCSERDAERSVVAVQPEQINSVSVNEQVKKKMLGILTIATTRKNGILLQKGRMNFFNDKKRHNVEEMKNIT